MKQAVPSEGAKASGAAKRLACATILASLGAGADAAADGRVLPVRERASATLLSGGFTFKVVRLRGYFVDVSFDGARQRLKLGEAFAPPGTDCLVTFEEISPETRIVRFRTDCE